MDKILEFSWKIKERPEDFIVKEVAEFEFDEEGHHHLYLLIKRNYNTKELSAKYNFSYGGLKDKNALTFQYVSLDKDIGKIVKGKDKDKFYILQYIGTIRKKIKIGNLKGNKFCLKLKNSELNLKDWMINYYDLQRVENNWEKGRDIFKELKKRSNLTRKKLSWLNNFYIDSYLSYLWNESLKNYLKERFKGYFVKENRFLFFIPDTNYGYLMENFPKFWGILGYKVNLEESKDYYTSVLGDGFEFDELIEILRKLKIKGDHRKTFVKVENISINGSYISFFLPKGSYGTMYLKHIFKG